MYTCVVCRFPAELDDVVAPTKSGGCVCLRCFTAATETSKPMPKKLRQEIIITLADAEAERAGGRGTI
jgi:recombinational DNA repair protein (RecF pathway)